MQSPTKRLLLSSVLLLGGLAAVVLTHRSDAHQVWRSVGRLPLPYLAGALLLVLAQLGLQTLRLWAVIPWDAGVGLRRTARAYMLGELTNLVIPARAGDALKVALLTRGAEPRLGAPRAVGAVLADKVLDAGSLVLLCAAAGLLDVVRAGWPARLASLPLALGGAAGVAVGLLAVRLARPRWYGRLTAVAREVGRGLAALRSPTRLAAGLACSLGAWLAELGALGVLCGSLGVSLSLPQRVLALAILNVGISLPVSFANIGVYEATLALGLSRAGVPLATTIAIATVHHAVELLAICLSAATTWLLVRSTHSRALHTARTSLTRG